MKTYIKETLKYFFRSKHFIRKELLEVERLYKMSEQELLLYKEEQFLNLFRRAIRKSPFYKKFYTGAGITIKDIQTINDIKKLPILTREMVRKNCRVLPTKSRWKMKSAQSSGTTGTPITVFYDYHSIKMEQAFVWGYRQRYGFSFGDKLVSLRGHLNYKQFRLHVHVSNTLFLSSFMLKKENALKYYDEIKRFTPKAIEGYPSSLYNLCLLFKDLGLSLNIPLTFTSSETLYGFQRTLIESVLNTKIFDYYGCTERTISLAEKNEHTGYYEVPGYSIVEFVDNSTYTTSLINFGFPLLRFQNNDQFNYEERNGKLDIIGIDGRMDDTLICKDGTAIGRIFSYFPNVKIAQIIQERRGEIILNIIGNKDFAKKDEDCILDDIYKKINPDNLNIKIQHVTEEEIIYSGRNKFSLVVSRLKS